MTRCLDDLVTEEGVVREILPGPDGPISAIYLVPFHRAEMSLANSLLTLLRERADRMPAFAGVDWARALTWLRTRTGTELALEQEQAVRLALTSKVAVLTGGPGCGRASPYARSSSWRPRRRPRFSWSLRPGGPRNASPS